MRRTNLDAEILEFKVRENSKITKKIIKELNLPRDATIGGVIRNGIGHIVLGDFQIQADDKVVVSCLAHSVIKVEKLFD